MKTKNNDLTALKLWAKLGYIEDPNTRWLEDDLKPKTMPKVSPAAIVLILGFIGFVTGALLGLSLIMKGGAL